MEIVFTGSCNNLQLSGDDSILEAAHLRPSFATT